MCPLDNRLVSVSLCLCLALSIWSKSPAGWHHAVVLPSPMYANPRSTKWFAVLIREHQLFRRYALQLPLLHIIRCPDLCANWPAVADCTGQHAHHHTTTPRPSWLIWHSTQSFRLANPKTPKMLKQTLSPLPPTVLHPAAKNIKQLCGPCWAHARGTCTRFGWGNGRAFAQIGALVGWNYFSVPLHLFFLFLSLIYDRLPSGLSLLVSRLLLLGCLRPELSGGSSGVLVLATVGALLSQGGDILLLVYLSPALDCLWFSIFN